MAQIPPNCHVIAAPPLVEILKALGGHRWELWDKVYGKLEEAEKFGGAVAECTGSLSTESAEFCRGYIHEIRCRQWPGAKPEGGKGTQAACVGGNPHSNGRTA
jgi:hypothetical protein